MSDQPELVLYRLKADWGLPSSMSIACIQVEAYLRLAKLQFAVQDCAWGSFSPTGQVPALDTAGGKLIGASDSDSILDEFDGAQAIISHLRQSAASDLDASFSMADKAEVLAFTTLIQTNLIPALIYSTWCETEAYSKLTRVAMASGLSFPLNSWLPFSARRAVQTHFNNNKSPEDIYAAACSTLDALASKMGLVGSEGFFLGEKPSSLDALLFACLAYLHSAPVVHPDLRRKLEECSALVAYVDRVAAESFSLPVFPANEVELQWSQWSPPNNGGGGGSSTRSPRAPSSSSSSGLNWNINRKGKVWMIGAGLAVIGYVFLSGQYFEIGYFGGELGEDDDGEEHDD